MSEHTFNPRLLILLAIIILAAAIRIPNAAQTVPWAHVTPIGAIALFGGAYFKSWKAFVFPMLALLISDLAIDNLVFQGKHGILHRGWYKPYISFLLIILLGKLIIQKVTVKNVVIASVCAAVMHWLIVDFGVWLGGGRDLRTMLPLSRDFSGLVQSYIQGLPFLRVFLTGTLIYGGIMFGIFEWLKRKNPILQLNAITKYKEI